MSEDGLFGAINSTVLDYLVDPYRVESEATILSRNGPHLVFDRTIFCPSTLSKHGDCGEITLGNESRVPVVDCCWDRDWPDVVVHVCATSDHGLAAGDTIKSRIDWPLRFKAMRVRSGLYLLSVTFPYPTLRTVVCDGWGSITFEVDDTGIEAEELSRLTNDLVADDLPIEAKDRSLPMNGDRMIPQLAEALPPTRSMRSISLDGINLQPSEDLYVHRTAEIGALEIVVAERLPGRWLRFASMSGLSSPRHGSVHNQDRRTRSPADRSKQAPAFGAATSFPSPREDLGDIEKHQRECRWETTCAEAAPTAIDRAFFWGSAIPEAVRVREYPGQDRGSRSLRSSCTRDVDAANRLLPQLTDRLWAHSPSIAGRRLISTACSNSGISSHRTTTWYSCHSGHGQDQDELDRARSS